MKDINLVSLEEWPLFSAVVRNRIHWIRIQIRHFRLNSDPDLKYRFSVVRYLIASSAMATCMLLRSASLYTATVCIPNN